MRPIQIMSASFSLLSTVISIASYIAVLFAVSWWAPILIVVVSIPTTPPHGAEESVAPAPAPAPAPKPRAAAGTNALVSVVELQRPITIYRQMLTMSANKCEKERPEEAKWLRGCQGALRDLTADPARVNEMALVRFFEDVADHIRVEQLRPDDVFLAHDRLVELRATIRAAMAAKKNLAVGQALIHSID